MEELRVGIVGSRRRNTLRDRRLVLELVERLLEDNPHRTLVLVSGGCPKGADAFAAEAARVYGVKLVEHLPRPTHHGRWAFVEAAFERNRRIAEDSQVGYALVHPDREGGTENTVGHYLELKKNVFLVDGEGRAYLSSMEERNISLGSKDPDKA